MNKFLALALGASLGVAGLSYSGRSAAETATPIPAAKRDVTSKDAQSVAVFAGGCFWGMEAVFEAVKGVKSVTSGYAGGTSQTATYDQVSTERTRHAEAVRIVYDPRVVSYATLLRIFFSAAHDPTQLNRQGPDSGPSYRSAIFPQNAAQKDVAAAYIAQLGAARAWRGSIVTRLESGPFYPAETYHQDFMRKNPSHPYIVRWDRPKLASFRAAFPTLAR